MKALLVEFSIRTRIVVPADADDDQAIAAAKAKILTDPSDYVCGDNVVIIEPDDEVPYDPLMDGPDTDDPMTMMRKRVAALGVVANAIINSRDMLDFPEKLYGYLLDESTDVEVGCLGIEDASDYAQRLIQEGFKMHPVDAWNTLQSRLEKIMDEMNADSDYTKRQGLRSIMTAVVSNAEMLNINTAADISLDRIKDALDEFDYWSDGPVVNYLHDLFSELDISGWAMSEHLHPLLGFGIFHDGQRDIVQRIDELSICPTDARAVFLARAMGYTIGTDADPREVTGIPDGMWAPDMVLNARRDQRMINTINNRLNQSPEQP